MSKETRFWNLDNDDDVDEIVTHRPGLIEAVISKGPNQISLTIVSDIPLATICEIWRDPHPFVTIDILQKIAQTLGLRTTNDLL